MTFKKKIIKGGIAVILFFTCLSLYSYSIYYIAKGGAGLGVLSVPLLKFSKFPGKVEEVLTSHEIKQIPPTYSKKDFDFNEKNALDYNFYGLNAFILPDVQNTWEIRLFNFRNDSVIYKWKLKNKGLDFEGVEKEFIASAPWNCVIRKDSSLIGFTPGAPNLFRLDKHSNVVWLNHQKICHHGMNMGPEGKLWVCTKEDNGIQTSSGKVVQYSNDFITKVDPETGEILFDKSVLRILVENGYNNLVYGTTDRVRTAGSDPIHLNDIQPAFRESEYWDKGDLFISCRNLSAVFIYRPSTNKIIRMLWGPFSMQHDVDILSDNKISLFNNNFTGMGGSGNIPSRARQADSAFKDSLKSSGVMIYNFKDSSYHRYFKNWFNKLHIRTQTQGFHHILDNGDVFVEEQNRANVYILSGNQVLYKRQFETPLEKYVERPHWVRTYEHCPL